MNMGGRDILLYNSDCILNIYNKFHNIAFTDFVEIFTKC